MSHPYRTYVQDLARVQDTARALPLGAFTSPVPVHPGTDAPLVMVFSPHPDDESIVGALPLRLLREAGQRVLVVAVTQGSNAARQAARLEEMRGACAFLGFDLVTTQEHGLAGINPKGRQDAPEAWAKAVAIIANLLSTHRPKTVCFPHLGDANSTHQGTHLLVVDALRSLGPDFKCRVVETEFWAPMEKPNLMIESTVEDVADLVAAITFHKGEVARNPYHLHLPAWMGDNVRRGGELVGGQGGAAPDFHFATLYGLRIWNGAELLPAEPETRILSAEADLTSLFA
ncbi:hypothetical protein GETHLI_32210 [Geothrix limicola]|uniref:PIG-L family deacetylase n=1 Tax=Geothrix limicola TaxID=2927978 RepID=A0ABQ5QJH2_9BACT|nr:PIG-L family deacetylase [Geothrix limicola]GLH74719.1 hypothetical protein GETHLI_32210 [Geothrix limicola]